MVKYIVLSAALLCLSSCSGFDVEEEYPNSRKKSLVEVKQDNPDLSEYKNLLKNQHPQGEQYVWPVQNAPELLQNSKEGEIKTAISGNGKPVLFAVLSEYPSAGKKFCKKYFVNLDLHLACFNPHWYPVRSFEGK